MKKTLLLLLALFLPIITLGQIPETTQFTQSRGDNRYVGPQTNEFVVTIQNATIANIQAAINNSASASGGTYTTLRIVLGQGTIPYTTTGLTIPSNSKPWGNIIICGAHPLFNYTSQTTPDSGWTPAGGTWFQGNGSTPLISFNSTDSGTSPLTTYTTLTTTNISFEDLGFDAAPIIIGAANEGGLTFGHEYRCFHRRSPGWALELTNAWDVRLQDVYFTGCFGAFYNRTALGTGVTEPGHVRQDHVMVQIPNWQIPTTANSTATLSCSTTNALSICDGMPECITTSVNGLTAWTVYYVVNYSQSAGTFGLATTSGGSALTMSGSTSMTMECPSWLCQCNLTSSDTVASSQPTNDEMIECQSNCQNRYHQLSQTLTANGTSTWGVVDATGFAPGLPVDVTTTANGLTTGLIYVVLSVNIGANTITLGTSFASSAITATGSGTMTIESYGFAPFEFRADASTSNTVAFSALDIDSEGTAETGFMGCRINQYFLSFQNFATTTISGICLRNSGGGTIFGNQQVTRDIDSTSSGVLILGQWYSSAQKLGYGIDFNGYTSSEEFELFPTGSTFGYIPDLRTTQPANDSKGLALGSPLLLPVTASSSGGNMSLAWGNQRTIGGTTPSVTLLPIVSDQNGGNTASVSNIGQTCLLNNAASGTMTINAPTNCYTFIINTPASTVAAGATYTNNSVTYTVVGPVSTTGTILTATGTGAPTSTGTLTYASGTGPATLTFTEEASQTVLNNVSGPALASVLPGQAAQVTASKDVNGNLFWVVNLLNGSGSSAPYNIYSSSSSVSNSGSTATTLNSTSIPGGTLSSTFPCVKILYAGTFASNTDNKTLAFSFGGGSSILPIGSSEFQGGWKVEVTLTYVSNTTAGYSITFMPTGSSFPPQTFSAYITGLTLSSSNAVLLTSTCTASSDCTMNIVGVSASPFIY